MPETNLQKSLTPQHLVDLPEEESKLREEVEAQVNPEKKASADRADDPRNEERYTFTTSYKDGRGKLWQGTFTTKILTLGDRQMVAVLRTRYQAGTPLEAMDATTADLNMKLAHLSFSLVDCPKWAENLRELSDPGIVEVVYEEVASHEAFFLGWLKTEGSSEA